MTVSYSDVARVDGRNPAVKVLKGSGERAAALAIFPFYMLAVILRLAPDC